MTHRSIAVVGCSALLLATSGCFLVEKSGGASNAGGANSDPGGPPDSPLAETLLAEHNAYRKAVGVPELAWSPTLAAHADVWAKDLASRGAFEHASVDGEGENLWAGTAGGFLPNAMVRAWGNEQKDFRNGSFPDVSTTGNWHAVGHYTQIVWRRTTTVGCAVATGHGTDVLVCRYAPPGNVMGQKTF